MTRSLSREQRSTGPLAALLGLIIGLGGVAAEPSGAETVSFSLSGVEVSLTLPETWQTGVSFPRSRQFWTASGGGQAVTIRTGGDALILLQSDAPLFRPDRVEAMRSELAGHPAEFFLARTNRGRNYVRDMGRSLDGPMLIILLDNCIGEAAMPVTLSLNRAQAFELSAPGDDFLALIDSLELALPADLRPCPPALTAGIERIEPVQVESDGWTRRDWATLSIAVPAGFVWNDGGDGEFYAEHPPFEDRDGREGWSMHFEIGGMHIPQLEGWSEGIPEDTVIETLPGRDFGPAGAFQQHRIIFGDGSADDVILLLLLAEQPDENGQHPALRLHAQGLTADEAQSLSELILDRIEGTGAP